ncbi:hypothetical protein Syun_027969 [Stephania yunnanensis]|uniref:Uncharacterized protein n=1 Tax=Stephania yunnanensis TaxID=152371 RepID=A0AAP0HLI0_9MAGN
MESKVEGDVNLCEKVCILEDKEPPNVVDSCRVPPLGPGTPNAYRENGEAVTNSMSPMTFVSSISLLACSEVVDLDLSPRTPKEDVFDPFAPVPDELMLAPLVKKRMEKAPNQVSRRLNFGSCLGFEAISSQKNVDTDGEEVFQEKVLLETLCDSILDLILFKQAEESGLKTPPRDAILCAGFDSPDKFHLLNGIAESCPDAPAKPKRSSLNLDLGICRRLEF